MPAVLVQRRLEAALKQVIARTAALDVTPGNVSVGLDGRFLVDDCSHYLIYGSESLLALARELEDETRCDILERLRKTRTPTVFEVNVPVRLLEDTTLLELLSEATYTLAFNEHHERAEVREIDFAVALHRDSSSLTLLGTGIPTSFEIHFGPPLPIGVSKKPGREGPWVRSCALRELLGANGWRSSAVSRRSR
ncbi:MAG: hypothetical protein NT125_09215 [Candidatus Bipolaricaulota bacterium]|nr:hypothetical protein [Candidatus Bipolaricaulota bacterium]